MTVAKVKVSGEDLFFDQVASNSWTTERSKPAIVDVKKAAARDSGKAREIHMATVQKIEVWLTEAPCCKLTRRKEKKQ